MALPSPTLARKSFGSKLFAALGMRRLAPFAGLSLADPAPGASGNLAVCGGEPSLAAVALWKGANRGALLEIPADQFVAGLSILRIHPRGGLANQIAIDIECTEKACFVTRQMRIYPDKSIDGDKEGVFDRGVVSPKA